MDLTTSYWHNSSIKNSNITKGKPHRNSLKLACFDRARGDDVHGLPFFPAMATDEAKAWRGLLIFLDWATSKLLVHSKGMMGSKEVLIIFWDFMMNFSCFQLKVRNVGFLNKHAVTFMIIGLSIFLLQGSSKFECGYHGPGHKILK